MSDATRASVPRQSQLFVVSAPSGAGKTSLIEALLAEDPRLAASVSHTTRGVRPGERDGEDYHFVDLATFESMVAADAFLEHAQVFGNCYGTSRRGVDTALQAGRDVVLEIDWQGARLIRALYPLAVSVFILPPSVATLRERLERRGEDPPEVIERRMREAEAELSHCSEYDYAVVNAVFAAAAADLRAIIRASRLRTCSAALPGA